MENTRAVSIFMPDIMDYTRDRSLFPTLDLLDHTRPRPPILSWADFLDRTKVRPAPAPALAPVNPSRVTDFSIERILSPDEGTKVAADWISNSCYGAPGHFDSYLQRSFYPSYPIAPWATAAQGYVFTAACNGDRRSVEEKRQVQQQQQQRKPRIRTVFTDSQLQRLEDLFERTRYPAPETRAETARRTGLSEETVRVWFKNHRARRKRQSSSPRSSHGH